MTEQDAVRVFLTLLECCGWYMLCAQWLCVRSDAAGEQLCDLEFYSFSGALGSSSVKWGCQGWDPWS